MDREAVIRLAQQAGFEFPAEYDLTEPTLRLERFANLVAVVERARIINAIMLEIVEGAWMNSGSEIDFEKRIRKQI